MGFDEIESAFKAGYHCQWVKEDGIFIFDPALKPGEPDEAYKAWVRKTHSIFNPAELAASVRKDSK